MVERLRAYRRWMLRRLGVLLPTLAVTLAADLWIALASEGAAWLKVVSWTLSALAAALLGFLIAQTVFCSLLHARGDRSRARIVRSQIAPYRGVAAFSLALLAAILALPGLFREAPAPERRDLPARLLQVRPFAVPTPSDSPAGARISEVAAEGPASARSSPQIAFALSDLPLTLNLGDRDLEPPPAAGPALPWEMKRPEAAEAAAQDEEMPGFRSDLRLLEALAREERPRIERLGLPSDRSPDGSGAPFTQVSVWVPTLPDFGRGGGAELVLDHPFGRDDSWEARYQLALFAFGESFPEGDPEFAWHKVTFSYVRRLAGHTRHAPFDFALRFGMSVDMVDLADVPLEIRGDARVSPYVGATVGSWEGGTWGVVLHAGQTIPVNVTGASSAVTDVGILVRLDLSERVSFQAGYRLMLVKFREFDDPVAFQDGRDEFEATLSGPLVGLDVRF